MEWLTAKNDYLEQLHYQDVKKYNVCLTQKPLWAPVVGFCDTQAILFDQCAVARCLFTNLQRYSDRECEVWKSF